MITFLCILLLQASAGSSASISGTVIDAGTVYHQPLFQARVEISPESGRPATAGPVAHTDGDGHFVFANLPAGKYRITAAQDGFLRKTATITVSAGQSRNDIVFALDVAPSVVGRVKDTSNVPVPNILVEALKVVYGARGGRSVEPVGSALTDDRGEFHLYWLDPGDYYLRASTLQRPSIPDNPLQEAPAVRYSATYYPEFVDPKFATKFRVSSSSRISAFDFRIQPPVGASVSGLVYIETTGALATSTITVSPAGEVASTQQYQGKSIAHNPALRDDGAYAVGGLPPGTYVLTARSTSGEQESSIIQKFTAKGGLRLDLHLGPGIPVTGQIVAESGETLDFKSTRALLGFIDPDLPSSDPVVVDANGKFGVNHARPGDYAIQMLNLPGDAYVKSAKSGDVDVLGKAFRIEYASPEPLRVTLGLDGGRIDGIVLDGANRAFEGARVVAVPERARRNSPDFFRATLSDDGGRFSLRGIPPGEYKLFAWQNTESNIYLDTTFIEGYEILGTSLTIGPGSVSNSSLRLIPMD